MEVLRSKLRTVQHLTDVTQYGDSTTVANNIDKEPPTPVVFRFAPPASARDLDYKLTASVEESSTEAKTQAKKNIPGWMPRHIIATMARPWVCFAL